MSVNLDKNPAFVEELRQFMLKNYAAWTNTNAQPDYETLRQFYEEAGDDLVMYDPQPPLEGYTGWANIERHIQEIVFAGLKSLTLKMNDDFRAWHQGDVAWSTFTANVAVITKNGQSSNLDYRQSNVWVRHNGRWIIVHENASPPVQ
ncbi:MAG: YybH family protein, partial [Xenococcaceae cyanobacterium]